MSHERSGLATDMEGRPREGGIDLGQLMGRTDLCYGSGTVRHGPKRHELRVQG